MSRNRKNWTKTLTKNSRKDALIIAILTWQGRFFGCYLNKGNWAELRGYTQSRMQKKEKLNVALNNLVAILDEYFPEYEEVFKNLLVKHQYTSWPICIPVRHLATDGR